MFHQVELTEKTHWCQNSWHFVGKMQSNLSDGVYPLFDQTQRVS